MTEFPSLRFPRLSRHGTTPGGVRPGASVVTGNPVETRGFAPRPRGVFLSLTHVTSPVNRFSRHTDLCVPPHLRVPIPRPTVSEKHSGSFGPLPSRNTRVVDDDPPPPIPESLGVPPLHLWSHVTHTRVPTPEEGTPRRVGRLQVRVLEGYRRGPPLAVDVVSDLEMVRNGVDAPDHGRTLLANMARGTSTLPTGGGGPFRLASSRLVEGW